MKHLFLILAFVVSTVAVKAQDNKPTKEETIAFINRTLNECKGFDTEFHWGQIESVDFRGNTMEFKTFQMFGGTGPLKDKIVLTYTTRYDGISWEKLMIDKIEFKTESGVSYYYRILFGQNMKVTEISKDVLNNEDPATKTSSQSNLYIFVPQSKAESIKKAFLRLHEIAKEENKDPFAH